MPKTRIKPLFAKPPRVRRLHHPTKTQEPAVTKVLPAMPPVSMPPVLEQYMKVNRNDCL